MKHSYTQVKIIVVTNIQTCVFSNLKTVLIAPLSSLLEEVLYECAICMYDMNV